MLLESDLNDNDMKSLFHNVELRVLECLLISFAGTFIRSDCLLMCALT